MTNDFFRFGNHAPLGVALTDSFTLVLNLDWQHQSLALEEDTKREVQRFTGYVPGGNLSGTELPCVERYDDDLRNTFGAIYGANPEQGMLFLIFVSSWIHELRHGHDLLSTSVGFDLVSRQMGVYQNAFGVASVLSDWQARTGRPIPLPLTRRTAEHSLPNDVQELVDADSRVQKRIAAYGRRWPSSAANWSTASLFEASATLTQFTFIHDNFGPDVEQALVRFLRPHRQMSPYLQMLDALSRLAHSAGTHQGAERPGLPSQQLGFLIWSSLSLTGRPEDGVLRWAIPPPVAFDIFFQEVMSDRKPRTFTDTVVEVRSCCRRYGWVEPFEATRLRTEAVRGRWQRIEAERGETFPFSLLSGPRKRLLECHDRMRDDLSGKLGELYFHPASYPWLLIADKLVSLAVRTRVDGSWHDFMSSSVQPMSHDDWLEISLSAGLHKLFVRGPFVEDDGTVQMALHRLRETGFGGGPMRFEAF